MHALELLLETAVLDRAAEVEVFGDAAGLVHLNPDCVPGMRLDTRFDTDVDSPRLAGDLLRDLARLCSSCDAATRYPVSWEDAHTISMLLVADKLLPFSNPVAEVSTLRTASQELHAAARWTPRLARWVNAEQSRLADQAHAVQDTVAFRVEAGRRLQRRIRPGAGAPVSDEQAEAAWVSALDDQRWYALGELCWESTNAGLFGLVGDYVPGNGCVTLPERVARQSWFANAVDPLGVPASCSRADVEDAYRIAGSDAGVTAGALAALEVART